LGDEGGGTWYGKALVTDFLYGNMPGDIEEKFKDEYHLDKEVVIKNVYQSPGANSYLASFTRFISKIRSSEYAQELLRKGMLDFIDTNIKWYPQYHRYKCHFVGSISYVFADELKVVCEENGVHIGKIIKQPIHDLLSFILSREG
jgi:N-acetylglucosamine kinase-like BadF-type ATPase